MSQSLLDPQSLALKGLGLIEASAGTGKTYTIVTLYLRLLLEAQHDVDRILVVTFTNAATEELRGRIRQRIGQALDTLTSGRQTDPVLSAILDRLPDAEAIRRRLADTMIRMDEAAVYTIHGFCQRMLIDHAFEGGVAFDAEFVTDQTQLRDTVMADFWRRQTAALDALGARWLSGQWQSPAALLKDLGPMARDERCRILPDPDSLASSPDLADAACAFADLKEAWAAQREEVAQILETHPAINRRSYKKNVVKKAVAAMDELVSGEMPFLLPREFVRFTPAMLQQQTKDGQRPPEHDFFNRCASFSQDFTSALGARRVRWLLEAGRYLTRELARRKHQHQVLFFDDLLRLLNEALAGSGGHSLAEAIRGQFPVALIDEFQDTDPLQYGIFRRIYGQGTDGALFLIGDPKQAIYSFRGADIFTYMQAKGDVGDQRIYTLGTNWRSAKGLVAALNQLFSRAHRPFLYDAAIPFQPVAAGSRAEAPGLKINGEMPAALHFWFLESAMAPAANNGFIPAGAARDAAAGICADHIARLLILSQRGLATLGDRPLEAGDMAVLVRSHRDGQLMQNVLRARNVASVGLSQESVFDSSEAQALQRLLSAVAQPGSDNRLKTALATDLMGWRADEIFSLDEREADWEAVRERFEDYRSLWLRRGFQVAFFTLLDREAIPQRLRGQPYGERCLTNLMHLGELLQEAAGQYPGIERLLRWLADQQNGAQAGDERLLRLESDEALVKIVTIHKSKGLEYPVVFIPFPWVDGGPRNGPVVFHDPNPPYPPCLDLGSEDLSDHQNLAAIEDLAERLRLFYVAVTRAKHHCVLTWGRINNAERSALAWLLHPDKNSHPPASCIKDMDEEAIRKDLEALAHGSGGTIRVESPTRAGAGSISPAAAKQLLAAREFRGHIPRDWRMTSYSGLLAGTDAERPDYDPASAADEAAGKTGQTDAVFRFPRGTGPGQCLHELFETLDFPRASGTELKAVIETQLERYAIDSAWIQAVSDIVTRVLDTDLNGSGLCLRNIHTDNRLDEMEFHFPIAGLDPSGLCSVLADFSAYVGAGECLQFDPVQGLMKGFVDLIFRHQGRFYIVDYKSNHLGDRFEDYGPEALRRAMAVHHYDLQYLIYTVALHRYLSARGAGYSYPANFGGVYYLFLRGMHPDRGPSSGVFFDRPETALIGALDSLFAGRGRK